MSTVRLNISLDSNIAKELEKIAKELGEKKSHIVKDALMYYFDYLDTLIAEKRLKALENEESELFPAKEVWKEVGLE